MKIMVKAHSLFVKTMGKKYFHMSWAETISDFFFNSPCVCACNNAKQKRPF